MITLQKCVPEIYYNQSRDFQFLARDLEVLANYLKTNADIIEAFPQSKNFDIHLLTLLAYTLGFNPKHTYNSNDLFSVCASFNEILKYKGSITAIKKAVRVLLNAQQIDKKSKVYPDKEDSKNLIIQVPAEVKDIILLEDLFDYILPCGFTYSFMFTEFEDTYDAVKLATSQDAKVVEYEHTTQLGAIAGPDAERFDYANPQHDLQQTSTGVVVRPDDEE